VQVMTAVAKTHCTAQKLQKVLEMSVRARMTRCATLRTFTRHAAGAAQRNNQKIRALSPQEPGYVVCLQLLVPLCRKQQRR
jgi:hypothetical protein